MYNNTQLVITAVSAAFSPLLPQTNLRIQDILVHPAKGLERAFDAYGGTGVSDKQKLERILNSPRQTKHSKFSQSLTRPTHKQTSTPRDILIKIKEYFSLNITELATIMQVGRPTIYNWLQEEIGNIRSQNTDRIYLLSSVMLHLQSKGVKSPNQNIHTRVSLLTLSILSKNEFKDEDLLLLENERVSLLEYSTKPTSGIAERASSRGIIDSTSEKGKDIINLVLGERFSIID